MPKIFMQSALINYKSTVLFFLFIDLKYMFYIYNFNTKNTIVLTSCEMCETIKKKSYISMSFLK